jgi:hypothetical protein
MTHMTVMAVTHVTVMTMTHVTHDKSRLTRLIVTAVTYVTACHDFMAHVITFHNYDSRDCREFRYKDHCIASFNPDRPSTVTLEAFCLLSIFACLISVYRNEVQISVSYAGCGQSFDSLAVITL